MRYQLLKQGPDDNSTYPECWGSRAKSDGRLVAEASRLVGLIDAAKGIGHSNWCVRDRVKDAYIRADDFWKHLNVVAAERANLESAS